MLSALQMVAGQTGNTDAARNAAVHAQVHLGQPDGMEGFGLQVDLQVEGIDDMELIQAGHKVSALTISSRTMATPAPSRSVSDSLLWSFPRAHSMIGLSIQSRVRPWRGGERHQGTVVGRVADDVDPRSAP